MRQAFVNIGFLVALLMAQLAMGVAGDTLPISFIARRDVVVERPGACLPLGAIAMDFNRDGALDLAVGSRDTSNIELLMADGRGGYQPPRSIFVGQDPRSLAAADFNEDDALDIAVVAGFNYVGLLFGRGDGTFEALDRVPANGAGLLVVGDFNRDGHSDLAVAAPGYVCCPYPGGRVAILLGQGNGAFTPGQTLAVGQGPFDIAKGDLNNDQYEDLVVPNFSSNTISLLLGRGDGTFQEALHLPVGLVPTAVAIGDFDADGWQDVAVTNLGSDTVSVLLGRGDGSFRAAAPLATGEDPESLVATDLNGDARADLAVVNFSSHNVSIFLSRGDGSFSLLQNYASGHSPSYIYLGDLNSDGNTDLLVSNYGSCTVSIYVGEGGGAFVAARAVATGRGPVSVAVGDFDEDGVLDLVTANQDANAISILRGRGKGLFDTARSLPASRQPSSVAVTDFNGDQHHDLIVANWGSSNLWLYWGKGDGSFADPEIYETDGLPIAVAVGDLNGDGRPDLVVANYGTGEGNRVSVFLQSPEGGFQPPVGYTVGSGPRAIGIGDFDGDKWPDLAVSNQYGFPPSVSLLRGRGDGTFDPAVPLEVPETPRSLALADVDLDNRLDLIVVMQRSRADRVAIYLGRGDGSFQAGDSYAAAYGPAEVISADFDRDGWPDIAVVHSVNTVGLLINRGEGRFYDPHFWGAGLSSLALAAGDFDGDERPDLVTANYWSHDVSILLNDTPQPPGRPAPVQSSAPR